MIYTLTPNPSLDFVTRLCDFSVGEINRSTEDFFSIGGKGINVSRVLKNLEVSSVALGFCGGFTGDIIKHNLDKSGISHDFVPLSRRNCRINIKIKAQSETDINAKGPEITNEDKAALFEKIGALSSEDTLILSGSVPPGLDSNFYGEILSLTAEKSVKAVVDAEGDLLLSSLKYRPFLVKPNLSELEGIFKKPLNSHEEISECAKELISLGAENVLVSMGGDGAALFTRDGDKIFCGAPCKKTVNTTGAGDSMVAGFVFGFAWKQDLSFALKMGICAGSASAFSDTLPEKDEIYGLYNQFFV